MTTEYDIDKTDNVQFSAQLVSESSLMEEEGLEVVVVSCVLLTLC